MGEFAGFDLDRSITRAWSRFRARLADHLAAMVDDDVLVVSADYAVTDDEDGAAPYVQFCAWGESLVRAEVSGNGYLAPEVRLDAAATGRVLDLGWAAPTVADPDDDPGSGSANFSLDLARSEADRLAVMAVEVLREVFAVPHPAFLTADGLEDPEAPAVRQEPSPDQPVAVYPRDREDLLGLVDAALAPVFGQPPEHDEDDDIPVVSGTALVFVRVLEDVPVVHLFGALVHGVTDTERAAFEVSVLNRDERFLKFVLSDDAVMAQLYLPAYPFVPEHLRAMLTMMSAAVDRIDDDLVHRVGGRRTFEPEQDESASDDAGPLGGDDRLGSAPDDDVDRVHPAILTLQQLDAADPGSVTPEVAAGVCDFDRDLILELITWSSGREISWRRARDRATLRGDVDAAGSCEAEAVQTQATVDLLRRALRFVVERRLRRRADWPGYGSD